jgi:hypothetical protein
MREKGLENCCISYLGGEAVGLIHALLPSTLDAEGDQGLLQQHATSRTIASAS